MQIYEEYWKITLEYTDYCGEKFNNALSAIVDFIDSNDMSVYNKKNYKILQDKIFFLNPKNNYASVRKVINQFLKLGFVNNFLQSYHPKTKTFLQSKDRESKRILFYEIMYDNASFNRSVTNPSDKNVKN